MPEKNFIVTELRILKECDHRYLKVLKSEKYLFNTLDLNGESNNYPIEANLYGKRIFIQTVVGMNGSGKSSLMELLYRMINNFSFYILKLAKPHRVAAEPVFLVEEIYADLDFIIDEQKCSIMVRGKSLGYINGKNKVYFGDIHSDFVGFANFDAAKKDEVVKLASSFFYTIVTNYSFQSLISKDFANDIIGESTSENSNLKIADGNWLDNLFRKNDGYITPIVLNPYREEGKIDLNKEYYLTTSRISALLIESKSRGKQLLEGYELANIQYKLNPEHFINKMLPRKTKEYFARDHVDELIEELQKPESLFHLIITSYGLKVPTIINDQNIYAFAYLVYKTLSVLNKYDQYKDFEGIPKLVDFQNDIEERTRLSVIKGIEEILKHGSHVNNKIHQTINFIKSYPNSPQNLELMDYVPFKTLEKFNDVDEILIHLPPPFYNQEIKLFKGEDYLIEIPISALSSGERQFIYTISTIIYHVKNLLSIQSPNRIRYRNINIILDEVEICFHPEYQRMFIFKFLELINRLSLTRNCSFNIIIVTHSPFVLSDIPKSNILYMQDGRQHDNSQLINPFAANINDILYQSFFLNGGFIGENAKKIIKSALSAIERKDNKRTISKTSAWNEHSLLQLIEIIGEPLLKENLLSLHIEAFNKNSYAEIIRQKDEEIEKLKDEIKKKSKN